MYENLNFFTIDALDNGYFENGEPTGAVERICFRSWTKKFPVKVYSPKDEIVQKAYEENKEFCDMLIAHKLPAFYADYLRLYILSKIPNSFYFDTDYYLTDFKLDDLNNFQIPYGETNDYQIYCLLYNGKDLSTSQTLFSIQKLSTTIQRDKDVIHSYEKLFAETIKPLPHVGLHFTDYNCGKMLHLSESCEDYTDVVKTMWSSARPGDNHTRFRIFTEKYFPDMLEKLKEIRDTMPKNIARLVSYRIYELYKVPEEDRKNLVNALAPFDFQA